MPNVFHLPERRRFIAAILLSLLITILNPPMGIAQPTEFWYKTYSGPGSEWAYSVVQTADGGYAIAGTTDTSGATHRDFYLVKTDSNGTLEWDKTYGGIADQSAYSMVQSHEGGYVIAGITNYPDPHVYDDVLVVKTDPAGNLLWNKTFGGADSEQAYSLAKTNDGGYVITGVINYVNSSGTGASDAFLLKIDGNGTMLWNKPHGGPLPDDQPDTGRAVIQTSDGGYVIAGQAFRVGLIIKTDADGNLEWNKKFNVPKQSYGIARAVIQTSDGGYVIGGTQSSLDIYFIKINSNREILWNWTFGGDGIEEFASMVQTNDGGYALVGYGPDYSPQNASGAFPYLIKTDEFGSMLWNKTWSGYPGFPESIIQTSDGGYALSGMASNNFFLLKTNAYEIPEFPSTLLVAFLLLLTVIVYIIRGKTFDDARQSSRSHQAQRPMINGEGASSPEEPEGFCQAQESLERKLTS